MAFTGYSFKDKDDIREYLEEQGKGKTFIFLSELAIEYNSYVFGGYGEKVILKEDNEKYYNSGYLINRKGELIQNYRKVFLYETDKVWAEEGEGFKTAFIINLKGEEIKVGLGICMDINPYEFLDDFKFELGNYLLEEKVSVLLFLSAWTNNNDLDNSRKSVYESLEYWMFRLSPWIKSGRRLMFICAD